MSSTTDQELEELRAYGAELAAEGQSPWEPRCIARAFATRRPGQLVLTMQGWIDLDEMRSPILQGMIPASPEEVEAAARVFGFADLAKLNEVEVLELAEAMIRAVGNAWSTSLRMKNPESQGTAAQDGFGNWLACYAYLRSTGVQPSEIPPMPVSQVYADMAAVRWMRGWEVQGMRYAMRDAATGEEEDRG